MGAIVSTVFFCEREVRFGFERSDPANAFAALCLGEFFTAARSLGENARGDWIRPVYSLGKRIDRPSKRT